MKILVMALAIAALFASAVRPIPVQDTTLARMDNGRNLLTRQTVQWPENEVEVCTDAHYKGECQREPQYINTCWPFEEAFNTSISSIRFDPSETDTAGAMFCSFYETSDCTFVLIDGTKRPVLHLLGPIEDLITTQFNDKLQSVRCNRRPKHSPKAKKSEVVKNPDDKGQITGYAAPTMSNTESNVSQPTNATNSMCILDCRRSTSTRRYSQADQG